MTDQQKVREAFESWITSRSWYERLHCNLKQTSDGNYCHYKVNDRWVTWQAAIAHASSSSGDEGMSVLTPSRVDDDGTEHYFVDGIGDLIPARHALRFVSTLIRSMDDEDRAMIASVCAERGTPPEGT